MFLLDSLSIEIANRRIVSDVSLRIGAGVRVCLLGPSGSGKSMIARAALGLLPPTARVSGRIVMNGSDVAGVHALSRPKQSRMAMVMQDTQAALNPLATIGYQLERPLRAQGLSRAAARARAAALLEAMHLPEADLLLRRCPPELSGGQRQRVCIAMALATGAPLMIADEPTTALDTVTQAQVLDVLHHASGQGPALLFITHDLRAAARLCDRAVVLQDGHVVETGTMSQILSAPQHACTRAIVHAARRGDLPAMPVQQAA
ncbi:dipeptide/oligopeptide/nickel ABC transporter ATP-binding protein [Falsirhodobacter deserti]|uniref:ABC transporter ATP-binding protein n=1 Tax=Falsirhodobacter deserti TaxID=1365611 RepID=UPI000FE29F51|nr:ABC transporter ATP-binding protein [Falsirhodobacter deserti]